MICANCGEGELEISHSSEWHGFADTPASCSHCSAITWISDESGGVILDEDHIPPYKLGFEIKVLNDRHPFYGEKGFVIDKDHDHYRLKFGSCLIWMPHHWVEYTND